MEKIQIMDIKRSHRTLKDPFFGTIEKILKRDKKDPMLEVFAVLYMHLFRYNCHLILYIYNCIFVMYICHALKPLNKEFLPKNNLNITTKTTQF